jgi:lipid-A-disaccharide synthase
LERKLRNAGTPTAHYVSPSVWAWRQGRVKKIARSTDLMLCLLPFEPDCYAGSGVDARFVGHTLADQIPLQPDVALARRELGLDPEQRYLALLPGSRGGEVERLGALFLDTAAWLLERDPDLKFLLPAANQARYQQLQQLLEGRELPVQLIDGRSREVMTAAEAVLIASGTATLEGMLLKKPMVISYKAAPLTYKVIRSMLKVPYVGLPNLLAGEMVAPEIMQNDATVENLGQAMLDQLADPQRQVSRYNELHQQLSRDASVESAKAVLELVVQRRR